jgi:flagellar basal-body rod protein FlgC
MKSFLTAICFIFFCNLGLASDPLSSAMKISAFGMKAQQERIKIIAQNIANKDSTTTSPNDDPYRRQIILLQNKYDRKLNSNRVYIKEFAKDRSQFKLVYDPSHPAADNKGYVKYPNVDMNIEIADSKDASRTFEANLSMVDLTKSMYNKTLDILK